MNILIIRANQKHEIQFFATTGTTGGETEREIVAAPVDWTKYDLIVFSPETSRSTTSEFEIPGKQERKNLENALFDELLFRLPVEPSDIVWFYRALGRGHYRVSAVSRAELDKALQLAAERNLFFDILAPAELISEAGEARKVVAVNFPEAAAFRPARHRKWKIAYAVLLFFFLPAAAILGGQYYSRHAGRFRELDKLARLTDAELRQQRRLHSELTSEKELLRKLEEAKFGSIAVRPVMEELTQKLPEHIWASSYMQSGDQVDLVLQAAEEDGNLYRLLETAETFQLVNLRRSWGAAQKQHFYHLKLKAR